MHWPLYIATLSIVVVCIVIILLHSFILAIFEKEKTKQEKKNECTSRIETTLSTVCCNNDSAGLQGAAWTINECPSIENILSHQYQQYKFNNIMSSIHDITLWHQIHALRARYNVQIVPYIKHNTTPLWEQFKWVRPLISINQLV